MIRRLLESQFVRFCAVGASGYAINLARALVVSALSLGANQLFLLVLVAAGAGHLAGQAVAIVLATPFSFAANKLWAFAESGRSTELQPVMAPARDR